MKPKMKNVKFLAVILLFCLASSTIFTQTSDGSNSTVVEDFESGNFSKLNWQFSGTQNAWQIEEGSNGSGVYAASANHVAFNDFVTMSITLTFSAPGEITFDVLQTDDALFQIEVDNNGPYAYVSPGEYWRTLSQYVGAGTHTIKFTTWNIGYYGEPFTMRDSVFIDNITFPNQPFEETAFVQVIHNSADLIAELVDVYINNELTLDNFAFRTATQFVDFPAGQEITVSVKGPDSQPADPPIWSGDYTLEVGERYILIADGLIDSTGYDPFIPFNINVFPMARQSALNNSNVDVLVHHGSTDAPTVDVFETGLGNGLLVNDLMYGEFSSYLEIPSADYQLSIFDETGITFVAEYYAPLATLGLDGKAITVVASGFLNPANNSDGAAFGLYTATPNGGELLMLPIMSELEGEVEDFETSNFSKFNWEFIGTENAWQIVEESAGSGVYSATAKHEAFNELQTMYVTGEFEEEGELVWDMKQTYEGSVVIVEVDDILYSYLEGEPVPTWKTYSLTIPAGVQKISFTSYVIGIFGEPWTGQKDSVLIDNIRFSADEGITDVENTTSVLPDNYSLSQNFPNPFNPSTTINFIIPNSDFVTLKVYNILGSEVATLVNENLSAGSYKYNFDALNLASGVYLYELKAGNFREIKKMNLLK